MKNSNYRWLVLSFSLLFQALSYGLIFYSFAVMLLPFQASFEVPLRKIMIATLCLQLGVGVFSALLGKFIDTWSPHIYVSIGGASLAAGFFVCSQLDSYWSMLVVYTTLFPMGLVLSGTLAAQSLAVKWFPERRGLALGMSAMGTSFGGFFLPPLVVWLLSNNSWQSVYLVLALACFLAICPVAWFLLRRQPNAIQSTTGPLDILDQRSWGNAEIMSQRVFWVLIIGLSPVVAAFTAIQLNIAAYANDAGLNATKGALLISVIALAMMFGKFFFASLSDRFSHRILFTVVILGHIITIFLLRMELSFDGLTAVMVVFGFSVGGVLPMAGAIIAHSFGAASFGRAMGLVIPFVTASSAIGPLIAASVRDLTGNYVGAFTLFVYFLGPAMVVVLFFLKNQKVQKIKR
jgi:MFS family permease